MGGMLFVVQPTANGSLTPSLLWLAFMMHFITKANPSMKSALYRNWETVKPV